MRLVEIKDEALKAAGVPFAKNTLFKWHSIGKYPELFVKLGRRLLLNLDEFNAWVEKETEKSKSRAKKINKIRQVY